MTVRQKKVNSDTKVFFSQNIPGLVKNRQKKYKFSSKNLRVFLQITENTRDFIFVN